jgi:hypothetical protein
MAKLTAEQKAERAAERAAFRKRHYEEMQTRYPYAYCSFGASTPDDWKEDVTLALEHGARDLTIRAKRSTLNRVFLRDDSYATSLLDDQFLECTLVLDDVETLAELVQALSVRLKTMVERANAIIAGIETVKLTAPPAAVEREQSAEDAA